MKQRVTKSNYHKGIEFEELCFQYFKAKGYKPEKTKASSDHGVDLIITDPKDGMKIAVQCKNYSVNNTVGNKELRLLEAGKRYYKCIGTLFITTSTFLNTALDYADSVKMQLWNGLTVEDKIGKWQKQKKKSV